MELAYFAEVGFDDVKISVKASSVPLMIEAYRLASETFDHPLHLGRDRGRAAARPGCSRARPGSPPCWPRGSATPSATRSPPTRWRRPGPAASCSRPWACGSARASTSSPARAAGGPRSTSSPWPRRPRRRWRTATCPSRWRSWAAWSTVPARPARPTSGIAAGRTAGHLFIKGKIVRVVPEDEMVEALVDEAEQLVAEGVEARLAAADAGAEAEAEADRRALLDAKGDGRQRLGDQSRADPQEVRRRARRVLTGGLPAGGPATGRIADHAHVPAPRPHPARGPGRCRGGQPSAAGPGRLHPPSGLGRLHLPPARAAGAGPGGAGHPRGARRRRVPGGPPPRPAPHRTVGAVRSGRTVRERRPPGHDRGRPGRHLRARTDARGGGHGDGRGRGRLLPPAAPHRLPDPGQVPGRGPTPVRAAPDP